MSEPSNVLVVTVAGDESVYEAGREAIRTMKDGKTVDGPAIVSFADEGQLGDVFDERTYRLLRVIRDRAPESIRETARLVGRDKKNVHGELTTLEALGVIGVRGRGTSEAAGISLGWTCHRSAGDGGRFGGWGGGVDRGERRDLN